MEGEFDDLKMNIFLHYRFNTVLKLNETLNLLYEDYEWIKQSANKYNNVDLALVKNEAGIGRDSINNVVNITINSVFSFNMKFMLSYEYPVVYERNIRGKQFIASLAEFHHSIYVIFTKYLSNGDKRGGKGKFKTIREDNKLDLRKILDTKILTKRESNLIIQLVDRNMNEKHHSIIPSRQKSSILPHDFQEVEFAKTESYIKAEKNRLITITHIYMSFSVIDDTILDCSFLKIKDFHLQSIILQTLLLFIFNVIHKKLAYNIIKIIFKNFLKIKIEKFSKKLNSLLAWEHIYLLGVYFDMYDHYVTLSSENLTFDFKKRNLVQELDMTKIIKHANILKNNKINFEKILTPDYNFKLRKNQVYVNFVKFLEKELNILDSVIIISQHLYDFLIFNKLDRILLQNSSNYLQILLEVRSVFFNYINKNSTLKLCSSLAERQLNEYKDNIINNSLCSMNSIVNVTKKNISSMKNVNIKQIYENDKYISHKFQSHNSTERFTSLKSYGNTKSLNKIKTMPTLGNQIKVNYTLSPLKLKKTRETEIYEKSDKKSNSYNESKIPSNVATEANLEVLSPIKKRGNYFSIDSTNLDTNYKNSSNNLLNLNQIKSNNFFSNNLINKKVQSYSHINNPMNIVSNYNIFKENQNSSRNFTTDHKYVDNATDMDKNMQRIFKYYRNVNKLKSKSSGENKFTNVKLHNTVLNTIDINSKSIPKLKISKKNKENYNLFQIRTKNSFLTSKDKEKKTQSKIQRNVITIIINF